MKTWGCQLQEREGAGRKRRRTMPMVERMLMAIQKTSFMEDCWGGDWAVLVVGSGWMLSSESRCFSRRGPTSRSGS